MDCQTLSTSHHSWLSVSLLQYLEGIKSPSAKEGEGCWYSEHSPDFTAGMINVSLQVTGDTQTDKWTISQSLPCHPSPTGLYIWILEFSTRNLGPILCFSNNPLVNVGATFEYFAYQSDCELVGSISNCSLLMIAATGTGGVGAPHMGIQLVLPLQMLWWILTENIWQQILPL